MNSLRGRLTKAGLALLVALVLAGCGRPTEALPSTGSPTPSPAATFDADTRTPSPEPSPSPSPTPTLSPTLTPTLTPTPTPTLTPSPTLTPTSTTSPLPQETAVPTADPVPAITYFRAEPQLVDPGDAVTLEWASTGATRALLYKLFYSGQLPPDGIDVAPTGNHTYEISPEERNWVNFLLYVWDDEDRSANAGASVELTCPETWFFDPPPEDICPTAPLISPAAEQHFEGGTMIWVAAEDAVIVLFDGPQTTTAWTRFEDRWDETMPERNPDLVAPAGRQQPIRGFGLVWREHPNMQQQLGWALDAEQGYTTVMQRTTRYKYNAWYLLALDGDVWYLGPEHSVWNELTPTQLNVDLN